jgi:hypothetical protein
LFNSFNKLNISNEIDNYDIKIDNPFVLESSINKMYLDLNDSECSKSILDIFKIPDSSFDSFEFPHPFLTSSSLFSYYFSSSISSLQFGENKSNINNNINNNSTSNNNNNGEKLIKEAAFNISLMLKLSGERKLATKILHTFIEII